MAFKIKISKVSTICISSTKCAVLLVFLLWIVASLEFMSRDEIYIVAPGFFCVLMVIWLGMHLWERDRQIPFFDVGMFCALATLVYTVYPLINYWAGGFQFGIFSDSRLQMYHVLPSELAVFYVHHVVYLFSFVAAYAVFRGKGYIETGNVRIPSQSIQQTIVIFFLLMTGYFFILQQLTGANYNASYTSGGYAKNLSYLLNLPLLLLQISSKLNGILFLFKLGLLGIVVQQCRKKEWIFILALWILFEVIQAVVIKGGRSGLILFLMAASMFYHRMIKPLTVKFLLVLGLAIFTIFIFMSAYRGDFGSLVSDQALINRDMFLRSNEFQALLGTAYDVGQRKIQGAYLPWYLYFNDFITIFPPQQFVPFEKIEASQWYMREIGDAGTGQGLMWGVISQSIIGWDWVELLMRGALLGYVLAWFHRWYLRRQTEFLATLVYLFFCLKIYYTFRDTTLSFLSNLVWEVLPFLLFLSLGKVLFPDKRNERHRMGEI